ncbi:calcium/sodium antiporter [Treponema phagedenis]|uniref:calcium/sodium antiporter n=1 Tax=Treponema phagedenis TaxID=162 RepID=UPI0001F63FF5|nr:calcium/sodium antiporter [Treponema phagedenis]EFW37118.1 K+-dependent Na+/Ca+ exchanger family protein [Treponema phagedenis F0421]TYT79602.1 calcium/sodium antiporter [Treponema phagedenis]
METALHSFLSNSNIFFSLALLCLSLYTLGKGADVLVDNAVVLSLRWGVPKMVLGATLVSLGTTLPEASVSVLAAIRGNADLALGNAIGSIIADTGLILGLAAIIGVLPVNKQLIHRQGLLQISAAVLLAVVSLPFFSPDETGKIYQWMGWVFVALLAGYLYISFKWTKDAMGTVKADSLEATAEEKQKPLVVTFIFMIIGIAVIIISSKALIPAVEVVAIRVGIPQSIIAATLVAFGTSLPELITAITAVRKEHGELAVGNIIGADILNVLFVLGTAAAVTPAGIIVPVYFFYLQIPSMIIILLVFRYLSTRKSGIISHRGGALLLSLYIIYLVLNFFIKG